MNMLSTATSGLLAANTGLAADASKLESLKRVATEKTPEANMAVAKQFESLFLNLMLKSMREAIPKDEAGNNDHTQLYTSMLDQQLSQALAAKGGLGLAEIIARQLGLQTSAAKPEAITPKDLNSRMQSKVQSNANATANEPKETDTTQLYEAPTDTDLPQQESFSQPVSQTVKTIIADFKKVMGIAADAASRASGIPAVFILAQAALESAWGKSEVIDLKGAKSHNLFGIKAAGNWTGKVAEALTTEFIDGVEQKEIAKFRAYDSYSDSFKDFANLIKNSQRYQPVLQKINDPIAYGQAMQDAGYATDPQYAQKLTKVIYMFLDTKD